MSSTAWSIIDDLKPADAALGVEDMEAAADALNAQTVPGPTEVPVVEVTRFLRNAVRADGSTAWLAILAAAPTNPAARAAVDYNADTRTLTIDLATRVVQGMLAALVASNVVTQVEADGVRALGQTSVPKWVPPVNAGHIQTARLQP